MFRLSTLILLILSLCSGMQVLAQDDLTIFTSPDGTFTFSYPAEWETLEAGSQVILQTLPSDQILNPDYFSVTISYPTDLAQFSMMGLGATPTEIVRANAGIAYGMAVVFSSSPEDFQDGHLEGEDEVLEQVDDLYISEWTINGYPAALATYSSAGVIENVPMYIIFIAADVGGGKIVTIQAISMNGESVLMRNLYNITDIADSMRYTAPEVPVSENSALPQTYSGPIGVWNMGTLTFNYPADWYVMPLGSFIQNTPDRIDQRNLLPGQLQVGMSGPEFGMMPFESMEDILACNIDADAITAATVMAKNLPTTPEDEQQIEAQGIIYEEPEMLTLNGHDVILMRFTDPTRDILVIMVDMGSGNVIPIMAFAPLGEMEQYEDTLLAIIETFEYTPNLDRCTENISP